MKEPKRIKKYLATLDKIQEYLEYILCNNDKQLSKFKKDIKGLKELLIELSIDKKEDRVKFFNTLKEVYKVEKK